MVKNKLYICKEYHIQPSEIDRMYFYDYETMMFEIKNIQIEQEITFNDKGYSNEITYRYQDKKGTLAVCQELYTDNSGKLDETTYSIDNKEVESLPERIMNKIEDSKKLLKKSDDLIDEFEIAGYFDKIAK